MTAGRSVEEAAIAAAAAAVVVRGKAGGLCGIILEQKPASVATAFVQGDSGIVGRDH